MRRAGSASALALLLPGRSAAVPFAVDRAEEVQTNLLPSSDEVWDWQVWMAKLGPKYTGNKAHAEFVEFLATHLKEYGIEVARERYTLPRWEAKRWEISMTSTQTGSTAPTPQPKANPRGPDSPIAQVKHGLDQMRAQLAATLPAHISVDRFQRVVLTAINTNPDLLSADRRSLFNAAVRAAQDGLMPDGREGALVIFKDKNNKKNAVWMPMVFGIIKKSRQSGEIA